MGGVAAFAKVRRAQVLRRRSRGAAAGLSRRLKVDGRYAD